MERYKLGKNDFDQINDLINVTMIVSRLYDDLCNLEIEGKKDTEQYSKFFNCLDVALNTEKNQYDKCNLTFPKTVSIINYLLFEKFRSRAQNDIEYVVNLDYKEKVLKRILNMLVSIIAPTKSNIKEILTTTDSKLNAFYSAIEIDKALEKDILNNYIYILSEKSLKENSLSIKKNLIVSKYLVAFINQDIERNLISSNFESLDTMYISAKFLSDYIKIEKDKYDEIKKSYGMKLVEYQILRLLNIGDIDYDDVIKSSSILSQCMIRSIFLLLDEESLENLNYDFNKLIESKEYWNRHSKDEMGRQLVVNCFRSIKKDRSKVKIISLRK